MALTGTSRQIALKPAWRALGARGNSGRGVSWATPDPALWARRGRRPRGAGDVALLDRSDPVYRRADRSLARLAPAYWRFARLVLRISRPCHRRRATGPIGVESANDTRSVSLADSTPMA